MVLSRGEPVVTQGNWREIGRDGILRCKRKTPKEIFRYTE